MAFNPTVEQKKAIFAPAGTLVSAAAGSGKTAVLVERVIDKICGENPISADRLLVVTFTKAAAKEMRGRIERRLSEEYAKNPENHFLLKQRIKFRNAKICTIDSFCIDLIRENFDRLGINPDFAIADDAVILKLSQTALSSVINSAFEKNTDAFNSLLDAVSSDYDEGDLVKYILKIYEFSQNMPFPRAWLCEQINRSQSSEFFNDLVDRAFKYAYDLLTVNAKNLYAANEVLKPIPSVYEKYQPVLTRCADDLSIIAKYCQEKNWDKVYSLVGSFTMEKLSTPRGFADVPAVYSAKALKDDAKATVKQLSEIFSLDFARVKADFDEMYVLINELISLTAQYMEKFDALRREKNVMTFSDTTHSALNLLCEYVDGKIVKTEFANEIIGRFDEVLVDEFQDTNDMQDLLFSLLSNDEKNIFIVGDIKQSIYRFRGANPQNFLKKKLKYTSFDDADDGMLKKIILSSNFRSRKPICEFINFLFTSVMNGKLSTVQYNDEEILNPTAIYPERDGVCTEIKFTDVAAASDKVLAEACSIAEYIKKFMSDGTVTDSDSGTLRRPRFSDFTVLFRNLANNGEAYAEVLRKNGIPVQLRENNFMESTEIRILFSLLETIENPTRDISVAAVMLSPLFAFSAEEIAQIRIVDKKCGLITAITKSAEKGDKKAEDFLTLLKKLRLVFSAGCISETISYILQKTDLMNIMSVLSGGEIRRRNLQLLESIAVQYDANGFSKRIEQFYNFVKKYSEKGLNADFSTESNSVNLMTIHSSKGLQFPICILADTTSNFSGRDSTDKLLISAEMGLSFKVNDEENSIQKSSITRNIISAATRQEQLDEEMRLLYVAMTRAKEQLCIFVTDKDVLKRAKVYAVAALYAKNLDEYRNFVTGLNSYSDMLCFALMGNSVMQRFILGADAPDNAFSDLENYSISYKPFDYQISDTETDNKISTEFMPDDDLSELIRDNLNYVYPYEALKEIESKSAVAVIAHKADKRDFSFTERPSFMSKNGLTPAARGTATHRFMQFADFSKAREDLTSEIDRLYEWEFITLSEKSAIDLAAVEKFFQSRLFARMERSERVEREMRFLTELPAGKLKGGLDDSISEEKVVIQGSVDCVFVEDDSVVVVDFKTDRVTDENALREAYAEQLGIYALACEKIFCKPVKQKIIYSFALSREIEL